MRSIKNFHYRSCFLLNVPELVKHCHISFTSTTRSSLPFCGLRCIFSREIQTTRNPTLLIQTTFPPNPAKYLIKITKTTRSFADQGARHFQMEICVSTIQDFLAAVRKTHAFIKLAWNEYPALEPQPLYIRPLAPSFLPVIVLCSLQYVCCFP